MSLELIRSGNKWFTKAVLIVIAVVFIFGFGYSFVNFGAMGGGPSGIAAEVNGEEISLFEYYRLRDSLLSSFGYTADIPDAALPFIRTRALNQLIDLKLISQKARDLGFKITDEELKQAITSNPAFQIDGDFVGFAAYKNFVEQNLKENVGEFERRYKEELLAQKFIDFINETAKLSDEELQNLYRIQNERIKLAYLKFSPDQYSDKVQVNKEEISKHYSENKNKYMHPEMREIEYLVIKPSDFEKNIEISDDEVKTYYDSYKDKEFLDAEGNLKDFDAVKDDIRAARMLEKKKIIQQEFIANLDEASKTKKLSEIGKEFAIEKTSKSTISETEQSQDSVPGAVRAKAFELKKGEKFFINALEDIWIVNLIDIKPESQKSLEEANSEVVADIKILKGKNLAKKESKKTHKDLVGGKVKLTSLKDTYKNKYNETDLFTRLDNISEISSKDVLLNAFLLDDKKPVYKEVYESDNQYILITLVEKKQIDLDEFEEKKEEIKNTMIQRKRNEIYQDWILSMRKQANIKPNPNLFPEIG